jgi:hypothetical protein
MSRHRKLPSAELLIPLRQQIKEWRLSRTGPGPMPDEIWAGAVALAKDYGICPVARALAIDYTALRKRLQRPPEGGLVGPTFVQLPATMTAVAASATTIEISARDGARMLIHLEAGRSMDTAGIVAAFLGSRG